MRRVIAVVEGHGEVEAVPLLIRRIGAAIVPALALDVPRPIRIRKSRLLRPRELERAIELAARQSASDDAILVLIDADDDCPAQLAVAMLERAKEARPDRRIAVVLAKREYEAWFLASAASLGGKRGLPEGLEPPPDPEGVRGAKEWLTRQLGRGHSYRETLDQPALTAVFDLELARSRSRSFEKLWRELSAALTRESSTG